VADLLLPSTDAGALTQAVAAAVAYGGALVAVRRDRELVLLVAGLATLTFAWFGLRALH
jgi:hypothetical protein